MEKRRLALLILISVLIAGFIGLMTTILILPGLNQDSDTSYIGFYGFLKGIGIGPLDQPFFALKTIISFVNIGLIIPLLIAYLQLYRSIKSEFTLSLMIVVTALLLYAVTSNPLISVLLGLETDCLGPFQIIPDIFTTIALIFLVRLTLQ